MNTRTLQDFIVDSLLQSSSSIDYFGEAALHFVQGMPLLLPVSGAEAAAAIEQFRDNHPFVVVRSLDNRIVAVRSAALSDIYLSSEAFDTFGPEDDRYGSIGPIDFDHDFWEAMHLELDNEFLLDERLTAEQVRKARQTLDNLKQCFPHEPNWDEIVRAHAQNVTWRYSGGATRVEDLSSRMEYDDIDVYDDLVSWFAMLNQQGSPFDSKLVWDKHPGHRTIAINLDAVDYISAPLHIVAECT